MALQHYGGRRSFGIVFAANQIDLSIKRRPNSDGSSTAKEFPMSSLWAMLQGEEIITSTYRGRVR